MLSGKIMSLNDIPEGDYGRFFPRFQVRLTTLQNAQYVSTDVYTSTQPGAFEVNLKLVDKIQAVASSKGCTATQLAIAWVIHRSRKVGNLVCISIPGGSSAQHVNENAKTMDVEWTDDDAQ